MASTDTGSKRPHDTPFKQQRLKAWQPILTPKSVVLTFLAVAIVFIPVGVIILSASDDVIESGPWRYDELTDSGQVTKTFTWPETTKDTVYVYYQLTNFYQNHRRYVKSRSDVQLAGSSRSDQGQMGDCDPWESWADHAPNDAASIDPDTSTYARKDLNPCGLIANSMFNDTLHLQDSSGSAVGWNKSGIAWNSDKDKKFSNWDQCSPYPTADQPNPQCDRSVQQMDKTDEDLIVWMRTAGLPTFKKLYRKIETGLAKGEYTMTIDQNFPVKSFDGEKAFYLSTTTWLGGKNEFLGWSYVVVGIIAVVLAFGFGVYDRLNPRTIGDPKHVHWN